MTLPWDDPKTKDHYDPKYVKLQNEVLGPKIEALLSQIPAGASGVTAKRARLASVLKLRDEVPTSLPYESFKDEIEVTNETFPSVDGYEVPIRIYKPKSAQGEKNGVYINFHGGGYALGDLELDVPLNYHLAKYAGVTVIDVDYRLVPEWNLATVFIDSYASVKYIKEHPEKYGIDPSKVAIGGTSAGGKIAIATAHLLRDINFGVQLVSANVPPIEDLGILKKAEDSSFDSMTKFNNDPNLNFDNIRWFEDQVASAEKTANRIDDEIVTKAFGIDARKIRRYEGPSHTLPNYKGLPKHILFVGDHDVQKTGGQVYAQVLIEHEIDVTFGIAYGLGHGHAGFSKDFPQGRKFWDLLTNELQRLQKGDYSS